MDTEDARDLELTFAEEDHRGRLVPLIRRGEKTKVTEKNKMDYIKQLTNYRLITRTAPILEMFKAGFNDVLAEAALSTELSADHLRTLLCGEMHIDVEELILCVNYLL